VLTRRIPIIIAVLLSTLSSAQQLSHKKGRSADEVLSRVAEFHGAPGVFAVAGYRIGQRALAELDENQSTFNFDVTHRTPMAIPLVCIVDGIQAATGVSLGKLNLWLVETSRDKMETVIRDKQSGKVLHFRLRPDFLSRFLDVPEERQKEAAREVLKLPDSAIFTVTAM